MVISPNRVVPVGWLQDKWGAKGLVTLVFVPEIPSITWLSGQFWLIFGCWMVPHVRVKANPPKKSSRCPKSCGSKLELENRVCCANLYDVQLHHLFMPPFIIAGWWWMEPWNFMTFPSYWEYIDSLRLPLLTNSIIFQRGRGLTTNQIGNHWTKWAMFHI